MPYTEQITIRRKERTILNHVIGSEQSSDNVLDFATTNDEKAAEVERITGCKVHANKKLKVPEIQDPNPITVAEEKAKEAWFKNGRRPILVEDTSLDVPALGDKVGTFDKYWSDPAGLRDLCYVLNQYNDRRATARSTFSIFDGLEVHTWVGETPGRIAKKPRSEGKPFGWDPVFIPNGQPRGQHKTFGEMTRDKKDEYSMRRKALDEFRTHPPKLKKPVFQLPEPYKMQLEGINRELFSDPKAMQYALSLRALKEAKIVDGEFEFQYQPVVEEKWNDGFFRYIEDPNCPDLGLLTTPMSLAVDLDDEPYRMALDNNDRPILWQMGPKALTKAIAERALEYRTYHNPQMYEYIRKLKRGEIQQVKRENRRSDVIEEMLGMEKIKEENIDFKNDNWWNEYFKITRSAASLEAGFSRQSAEIKLTRKIKEGLIHNPNGVPTSVFGYGGMPPVSGWKDSIVSAAMGYGDIYIPRNSLFADPERRIKLFKESCEQIRSFELPSDIEDNVLNHIGVSLEVGDSERTLTFAHKMYNEGCRLFRIYTTNPDPRTVEMARALRKEFGDQIRICVGPVTDMKQARELAKEDIKVDIFLAGHGGGENCTSLESGAASNALELIYLMSIDPTFNYASIGLEGGTGEKIGHLLPFVDVISLNRRGVAAGIECGSVFAEYVGGRVGKPYPGSAGTETQRWEIEVAKKTPGLEYLISQRMDDAGDLKRVEGKSGSMDKPRKVNSIHIAIEYARSNAGGATADQKSQSIQQLRQLYNQGELQLRIVSPGAEFIAGSHRN